jgi:hypothetical protein
VLKNKFKEFNLEMEYLVAAEKSSKIFSCSAGNDQESTSNNFFEELNSLWIICNGILKGIYVFDDSKTERI